MATRIMAWDGAVICGWPLRCKGYIEFDDLICRGAVICPAYLARHTMAAGPDVVRWSGPIQSSELEAPTAPRVVLADAAAFRSSSSLQWAPLQFDAAAHVRRDYSQIAADER